MFIYFVCFPPGDGKPGKVSLLLSALLMPQDQAEDEGELHNMEFLMSYPTGGNQKTALQGVSWVTGGCCDLLEPRELWRGSTWPRWVLQEQKKSPRLCQPLHPMAFLQGWSWPLSKISQEPASGPGSCSCHPHFPALCMTSKLELISQTL